MDGWILFLNFFHVGVFCAIFSFNFPGSIFDRFVESNADDDHIKSNHDDCEDEEENDHVKVGII